MKDVYWSNGVIRNPEIPITDYVNPIYGFMYKEKELDDTSDRKAETIKHLLHHLMRTFVRLLKMTDQQSPDRSEFVEKILERQNDPTEEIERTAMNIVRLLNTMREYQFRENLIRSLKAQIEQKKQLNEEVQDLVKKVRDTVQSSLQDLHAIPQAPAEGQPLPEGVAKQTQAIDQLMRDLERMSKGDYPSLEGTSDEMETVVSWCVG
ncbi:hypothetical protein WA577_003438 [Blastocystis sp. JDR]